LGERQLPLAHAFPGRPCDAGLFGIGGCDEPAPRNDRRKHLFRPPLEPIINMSHLLVRLAQEIDWGFLDQHFSAAYRPGPGQPPLPTRLVASLFIIKHMHASSDEALCARWLENPYYGLTRGQSRPQSGVRP
jgi:hypothetical protein